MSKAKLAIIDNYDLVCMFDNNKFDYSMQY